MTPLDAVRAALSEIHTQPILLACSGGGDSTALLHLVAEAVPPTRLHVATIQHNLRPDAAEEIALVALHCAALGLPHRVFDWHWSGRGNLQAQARQARRDLLMRHAAELGGAVILLGHTSDDQAETVLLRLARGSGTDGLAGMARFDPPFLRPLLPVSRAALRAWLTERNIDWAEDPSNDDPRFDRVKARAMAQTLAGLGLDQARLVATASVMAEDAELLAYTTERWISRHIWPDGPDLLLSPEAFEAAPKALAARVLSAALTWFSGVPYKPRRRAMAAWQARIAGGTPAPLGGVLAHRQDTAIRLYREPSRTAPPQSLPAPGPWNWDMRWQITGPARAEHQVMALGERVSALDWRATGIPRDSLLSLPAIVLEDAPVAVPFLQPNPDWHFTLTPFFGPKVGAEQA